MMNLVVQAIDPPLAERLLVAIVGPLVSAVFGTGAIGFVLWKISRRADANRAEVEDARARHEVEGALRQELLTSAPSASTSLYLATQHFWRVKTDTETDDDEKSRVRKQLDEQYRQSRAQAKIMEVRLQAMFDSSVPARNWHRVDDLLTVRYMQLVDRDTERLYQLNVGELHTGLSIGEMKNRQLVLNSYHEATRDAVNAIMEATFRKPPRDVDGAGS